MHVALIRRFIAYCRREGILLSGMFDCWTQSGVPHQAFVMSAITPDGVAVCGVLDFLQYGLNTKDWRGLEAVLSNIVEFWQLGDSLTFLTGDRGPDVIKMFSESLPYSLHLAEAAYIPCIAHFLNNAAQGSWGKITAKADPDKEDFIAHRIMTIFNGIRSGCLKNKLQEKCKEMGCKYETLVSFCDSRWPSDYEAYRQVLQLYPALNQMIDDEGLKYTPFSHEDIAMIKVLLPFLGDIKEAVKLLSRDEPNVHCVIALMVNLRDAALKGMASTQPGSVARRRYRKLTRYICDYWSDDTHGIRRNVGLFFFAHTIDPANWMVTDRGSLMSKYRDMNNFCKERPRKTVMEDKAKKDENDSGLKPVLSVVDEIMRYVRLVSERVDDAEKIAARERTDVEYVHMPVVDELGFGIMEGGRECSVSVTENEWMDLPDDAFGTLLAGSSSFFDHVWSEFAIFKNGAIDLQTLRTNSGSLLQFWSTPQVRSNYPNLRKVVLATLTVRVEEVECERLFSSSGLILTKRRSRLELSENYRRLTLLTAWRQKRGLVEQIRAAMPKGELDGTDDGSNMRDGDDISDDGDQQIDDAPSCKVGSKRTIIDVSE